MKVQPLDTVARVQLGRMVEAGAKVVRPAVLDADFAGSCMLPRMRTITYRHRETGRPIWADVHLRCRRCESCRKQAQREWMARAIVEAKLARRNWFGTLTLNPATRMEHLNRMRAAYAKYGADYDAISPDDRWRNAVRLLGRDVTLWLKRVREQSGGAIRYMLCIEQHRDGTPHLHGLVHEGQGGGPVGRRALEGQWSSLGFSQWRLQQGDAVKAAAYATKYITKTIDARVRASIGYGNPEVVIAQAVRSGLPTPSGTDREPIGPSNDLPHGEAVHPIATHGSDGR